MGLSGPSPPRSRCLSIIEVSTAAELKGDLFRTNSVKVLNRAYATKFPMFKVGQVLLSLRNLDTLALVDTTTFFCGNKQSLSNGATLILDPDNRRFFEVTRDKNLVWEIFCRSSSVPQADLPGRIPLTRVRRYGPGELTFLKGRDVLDRNFSGPLPVFHCGRLKREES